jgi:hypothetical protein
MIKVEPCKGCGGVILVDDFMGVRVRCEASPLDAQTAGAALLAGLNLYRVHYLSGRPSTFASASPAVLGGLRIPDPSERPMVVVQHRCKAEATGAALRAPQGVKGPGTPGPAPKAPQNPPAAPGTLSSAPSTEPSGAITAAKPVSEGPGCDGCGEPMADGTFASIELGEVMIWKHHVEACGA